MEVQTEKEPLNNSINGGQYTQNQDEIELFDVVSFFWKIKSYLIWFTVLGFVSGLIFKLFFIPIRYSLSMQATIQSYEGAQTSEPEKLTDRFYKVLGRPEFSMKIMQNLVNNLPELKDYISEKPQRLRSLMSSFSSTSRMLPPFIKITATNSAQDFTIDAKSPVDIPGGKLGPAILDSINKIVELNNQGVAATDEYQMNEFKNTIRKLQNESDVAPQKIRSNALLNANSDIDVIREQSEVWQRCTKLETKLFRLAEQKGVLNQSRSMLFRSSGSQSSIISDVTGTISEVSTVNSYRLLALLEEEKKLSDLDPKQIREDLISLDRRLEIIRREKLREQSLSQNVLQGVLDNFQKNSSALQTKSLLLPKLRLSQIEENSQLGVDGVLPVGSYELVKMQKESDFNWLFVSLFGGLFCGFLVGAARMFWVANRPRLLEVIGGK